MSDEIKKLIDQIWDDDLLDRKSEAEFLQRFLVGRMQDRQAAKVAGSYVVNIDARWGAGKTFFLERLGKQLEIDHVVARVNAWRDDHLDDPFIAILAAIDEALKPYVKKEKKAAALWKGVKQNAAPIATRFGAGVAKTLLKKFVGKDEVEAIADMIMGDAPPTPAVVGSEGTEKSALEEAIEAGADEIVVEIQGVIDTGAQKLIDQFNSHNASAEGFRQKLETAIGALTEKKIPLFILIDGLDRCRPSYAISLLERVKHLFDANNVAFVFATNSDQLQHSIAGAYGANFDGFRYLKRFFDRTYQLSKPPLEQLVAYEAQDINLKRLRSPMGNPVEFLAFACSAYEMDLRQIKQVTDIIRTVSSAWTYEPPADLIGLFPLAAQFDKVSAADWSEAAASIPDKATIEFGTRYNHRSREESITFNLKEAFILFSDAIKSFDKSIRMGEREGMGNVHRYVFESISPEWNGRAINRSSPSIQIKLSEMVAMAGRIVDEGKAVVK